MIIPENIILWNFLFSICGSKRELFCIPTSMWRHVRYADGQDKGPDNKECPWFRHTITMHSNMVPATIVIPYMLMVVRSTLAAANTDVDIQLLLARVVLLEERSEVQELEISKLQDGVDKYRTVAKQQEERIRTLEREYGELQINYFRLGNFSGISRDRYPSTVEFSEKRYSLPVVKNNTRGKLKSTAVTKRQKSGTYSKTHHTSNINRFPTTSTSVSCLPYIFSINRLQWL